MPAPVKIPQVLPNGLADLQPGDIVFFTMKRRRASKRGRASDNFVRLFQSFVQGDNGHKNTEHNGIVIEESYVENGVNKTRLRLAHLTFESRFDESKKDKKSHFKLWDPSKCMANRNTVIYRIKDEAHRRAMAAELQQILKEQEQELKRKLKFHFWYIVKGWFKAMANSMGFRRKNIAQRAVPVSKKQIRIARNGICTQFVMDSYCEAARRLALKQQEQNGHVSVDYTTQYMNMRATMLKSMQSYLHNNTNYDCFIGENAKNGYKELVAAIEKQRDRLRNTKGIKAKSATLKAQLLQNQLAIHQGFCDRLELDQYVRSIALLHRVMPVLAINTGTGAGEPHSYRVIKELAKTQSIYPAYYSDRSSESVPLLEFHLKNKLHYNPKQTEVYMQYRKLGYSDRAARFEAKPTMNAWFENNKRKLKASALSLVGFFPMLIAAKVQVDHAKKRNYSANKPRR